MPSGQDTQANRSPPRTPPSQASNYKPTKRGLHPRPSLRETFLDDMNPADNANSGNESSDERDPHDLSLSPKHAARTSIVDNMLLSLDQFAFSAGNSILDDYRLFNSVFESELYGRNSQESTTQQRYRGHTFSSSLSSEADLGYDDSAARYGTQPARGRRSNSSSNYHSGLRRIGSTRSRDAPGSRGQLYDYRTVAGGDPSAMRTTRKSSKASASSTLDFGPPLIRAQAGSTNERRSASFDYGTRPTLTSTDFESTFYDSTDAAPTPSVPAGPRKLHSSSQNDYSGPSNSQSSRTPVVSRRNSPKSSRTNQARKSRPENINSGANMRGADSGMRNLADDGLDPPPNISATLDPPAPSPTISFNKPTLLPPPEPAPVKERPGFFRRVFGSSRSSVIVPAEASHYDSPISLENDTNQVNAASGTLRGSRQPQRNHNVSGASTPRERPPQVVNKKPSFFRRRKKSISIDNSAPPPIVLPQQLGPRTMEILKPEPSPVSSLRKVMNPYLADGVGPACDKSKERPARAAVADDAANKTAGLSSAQRGKEQVSAAPVKGVSKSKYSLYPPPPAGSGHDTSFLMNSSGNEESTVKAAGLDSEASVDPPQRKMAVRDGIESQDNEQVGQVASESQHTITPPTMIPAPALSPVVQNLSPASATAQDDGSKETTTEDKVHPEETAEGVLRSNSGVGGDRRTAQLSKLTIPATETAGVSPHTSPSDTEFFTAANTPAVPSEDPEIPEDITERPDSASSSDEPTSSDREHARRLFDSQDQVVGNEPAAAWLGDPNRATIREAYMELFNWSNMNILAALRSLCTRLILKGETQQVDRVLDAFSTRWCQCNPRHGFKASDVVHTICYSLLLLNTDLHLADIEQKMTKTQFVRNTMSTIHRVAIDAAPDSFDPLRPANRARLSAIDSNSQPTSADESERANGDVNRPTNPPPKLSNRLSRTDLSIKLGGDPDSDIGPLVNAPFNGSVRAWEQQVETVLRDFYSSIQKQKLPLHGASGDRDGHQPQSNSLLGPGSNHHGLRRSPSTISKSGSDIYPRGRSADSRYGTARWSSKPRSRARLCPPSTMGSSRTSLDDQSSLWSPSASSTWSKYSLGKLTSASVDSFGSDYPRGDYQQSIGFANALSQAIIREDTAHSIASSEDVEGTVHLLEDETLQLAGAPWAKEGSLKHKHHLDSVDKRAKDRNWNECFAVIQQGWMRLFSFSSSAKSVRPKPKPRSPGGLVVGGGNWTENAEEIWKFLLRQSIASALPPPGYSKSRPHVWALSLPTGAVHLFQAGTPEIVREFVSTANYWSARLSKEPLIGGISNMEFGWSDAVINSALVNTDHNKTPPSSSGARPSIQSSIRSSIDQQGVRPRLPADRVHIGDWAPPQQSMVASGQPEVDQLKALQTYVKNVEEELQRHNELRPAMILAFSPRHPNAIKAMANWERKSSYLLREIVKFRTYIDSLQGAIDARNQIYASREDETPERAED